MAKTLAARGLPSLHILGNTPRLLRNLIAAATKEQMEWQPAPDRWSITMVLAHLADVEERGFLQRYRAISQEEMPSLPAYDQLALFRTGKKFDGREELEKFERQRKQHLPWLQEQPDTVLERRGKHQELGILAFRELLQEHAFHDLGHVRQVAELYRSHVFYPEMGVFRSYYQIHP